MIPKENLNLLDTINSRIESEIEVKSYIQNLKYALDQGAKITFQVKRLVDESREEKYTNQYTVDTLFPNEKPFSSEMFPYRKS